MAGIDWTASPLAERKERVLADAKDEVRLLGVANAAGGFGQAVMALEADGMLVQRGYSVYPVEAGGVYTYRLTDKGRVAHAMLSDAS